MDFRQYLAGVLTISMFVMLGNMVKKEHVDPFMGYVPVEAELELKTAKYSSHRRVKLSSTLISRPWMEDQQPLRPCSTILPHDDDALKSRGNVFFQLSHEPEYHAFQVGIAILIARQLGAALVLPDISCNNKNKDKRLFGEIYDINHFITTLEGIVHVVKDPPTPLKQQSKENIITFRISNTISEQTIQTKINPLFKKGKQLRFTFHSASSSSVKGNMNPYTCLAMFRCLKLQSELQGVVDSIVGTLRSWSSKSFGKFVAVDLRTDENRNKSNGLQKNSTENNDPRGIAEFLKRFGFERETSIYLSQVGRHDESLVSLRQYFPTTFTKEAIFPMELKAKYLNSEDTEFRKLIDLYICTQSDVFVSGFSDQFQSSVVAMRIGLGKTQILRPEETSSTFAAADIVPTYVSKKTYMSYSCFC